MFRSADISKNCFASFDESRCGNSARGDLTGEAFDFGSFSFCFGVALDLEALGVDFLVAGCVNNPTSAFMVGLVRLMGYWLLSKISLHNKNHRNIRIH